MTDPSRLTTKSKVTTINDSEENISRCSLIKEEDAEEDLDDIKS